MYGSKKVQGASLVDTSSITFAKHADVSVYIDQVRITVAYGSSFRKSWMKSEREWEPFSGFVAEALTYWHGCTPLGLLDWANVIQMTYKIIAWPSPWLETEGRSSHFSDLRLSNGDSKGMPIGIIFQRIRHHSPRPALVSLTI